MNSTATNFSCPQPPAALFTSVDASRIAKADGWVELAPPRSQATVALVTWFEQMPPGSVTGLVLDTPDAKAAYAALSERGVEFTGEVREDPWGTSASFVDPDGNGWVLMQSPEGEPAD